MNNRPFVLITGASQGIGRSMALELGRRGHNLALHSLPGEGLSEQCRQLSEKYGIESACYEIDLTATDGPQSLYKAIEADGHVINILINNAGVGIQGPLETHTAEGIDKIIYLNIRALTMLTFLFTPMLKKSGSYILNVSSLGCYMPTPYKSVYVASKSYIYYFTRSLEAEFRGTNVRICLLVPGGVKTNQDVQRRINASGWLSRSTALEPDEVACVCLREMFGGKKVVMPGKLVRFVFHAGLIVPEGLILAVTRNLFRKGNPT